MKIVRKGENVKWMMIRAFQMHNIAVFKVLVAGSPLPVSPSSYSISFLFLRHLTKMHSCWSILNLWLFNSYLILFIRSSSFLSLTKDYAFQKTNINPNWIHFSSLLLFAVYSKHEPTEWATVFMNVKRIIASNCLPFGWYDDHCITCI